MSVVLMVLFVGGLFGIVLNKQDLIRILVGVEMSLSGICNEFIITSVYNDDMLGQVLVVFIILIAGGESSILLGMYMKYNKLKNLSGIDIKLLKKLKG